jgi:protein-tyrosine phosphatase
MDKSNYDDVIALYNRRKKKKSKIMLNELFPNENVDVPDPYYGMAMVLKWFTIC